MDGIVRRRSNVHKAEQTHQETTNKSRAKNGCVYAILSLLLAVCNCLIPIDTYQYEKLIIDVWVKWANVFVFLLYWLCVSDFRLSLSLLACDFVFALHTTHLMHIKISGDGTRLRLQRRWNIFSFVLCIDFAFFPIYSICIGFYRLSFLFAVSHGILLVHNSCFSPLTNKWKMIKIHCRHT